jgi:hypothetical protein
MHASLCWTPYCILLTLRTAYCAFDLRQNGPMPLIHGVINIPTVGFRLKTTLRLIKLCYTAITNRVMFQKKQYGWQDQGLKGYWRLGNRGHYQHPSQPMVCFPSLNEKILEMHGQCNPCSRGTATPCCRHTTRTWASGRSIRIRLLIMNRGITCNWTCRICSSHSGGYEEFYLLGYNAV